MCVLSLCELHLRSTPSPPLVWANHRACLPLGWGVQKHVKPQKSASIFRFDHSRTTAGTLPSTCPPPPPSGPVGLIVFLHKVRKPSGLWELPCCEETRYMLGSRPGLGLQTPHRLFVSPPTSLLRQPRSKRYKYSLLTLL